MMGFQSSPMKFAHFFFLCEAVVFAGTSLLIFCGCCARDFEMANNYATVFFCLFMMFDGHYINNKAISAGSRSELLGLGDLHGCSNPESSRCIFQRGGDAVDYYGFRDKPFRKAITAIMLISVALRALAFIAFKFLFTGRPVFDSCSSKKQQQIIAEIQELQRHLRELKAQEGHDDDEELVVPTTKTR